VFAWLIKTDTMLNKLKNNNSGKFNCSGITIFKNIFLLILVCTSHSFLAQSYYNDSLEGFNSHAARAHSNFCKSKEATEKFMERARSRYINKKFYSKKMQESFEHDVKRPCSDCGNIDFENNNTNGWTVSGDHEIVAGGKDPFGKFDKVFPGAGKYSLRLNDNNISGKSNFLAKVSRVINVGPANNYLNLHFAMVILNFPHDSVDAARFRVKILDANNNELSCPQFQCYFARAEGPVGVDNFQTSDSTGINIGYERFKITYSPWQSIGLDLSTFNGQTITIEISCDWCIYEYDWAYCYIDADCNGPLKPEQKCAKFPHNFFGPLGMQSYSWYPPGGNSVVSETRSCTAMNAGTYTLLCNQNKFCNGFPLTYLYNFEISPKADFNFSLTPCDMPVKFACTAQPFNENVITNYLWQWKDGGPNDTGLTETHVFLNPGIHSVKLLVVNNSVCKDSVTKNLRITSPVSFTVNNLSNSSVLNSSTPVINLHSVTSYTFGNLQYTWLGNCSPAFSASVNITQPGTYTVTALDPVTKCSATQTVLIEALAGLEVPNVFTPNCDGKNDVFIIKAENLKVITANIYDRWGNKVYASPGTRNEIEWDGRNLSGKECADGTFFYIISGSGIDGKEIETKGTVCLFR